MRGGVKSVLNRIAGLATEGAMMRELSARDRELISFIRQRRLTYLSKSRLAAIARTCRNIEESRLSGIFVEAGCALGGSTILIARTKRESRPLYVYDVFGMIPPPTGNDPEDVHDRFRTIAAGNAIGIGGDSYYGYEPNLYDVVKNNLASCGIDREREAVSLIKGLVQETMYFDQPVAFAHVDVDWYDPVMTCLTRIFPHLVVGGAIILDDYYDWGGCRKAADEFLSAVKGDVTLDGSAGSLKITRVG